MVESPGGLAAYSGRGQSPHEGRFPQSGPLNAFNNVYVHVGRYNTGRGERAG